MERPIKVNIYGDSLLRGTVIDERCRYHATVAQYLGRLAERFNLRFSSRARFGFTIGKGHELLRHDLAEGLECEYAVIAYGGNDCSFLWDEVAQSPAGEHLPLTPLEDFRAHCADMCGGVRAAGAVPVLMTLPPIDAGRHLAFIGKTEQGRQSILQWLGDVQMIYRFHELYSLAIEKLAAQTGALLVDVRSRFLDRHDLHRLLGHDGVHLNSEGYGMLADAFADFVAAHRREPGRLVFE